MTYRPTSDPETWRTLEQIRNEVDEGKWFHSRIYEDIEVAVAIGHIHDFWELPEDIQSYAIARSRVRGTREAYEEKLQERESKRNKNRTGTGLNRKGK